MGVILYITATLLRLPLFFTGMLYGIIKCFHGHRWRTGFQKLDKKFLVLATSIDKYGNVVLAELLNDTLIRREAAVRFGRIEQTISAVLGHNQAAGTLTRTGTLLARLLDAIDHNHVADAALDDKHLNCL